MLMASIRLTFVSCIGHGLMVVFFKLPCPRIKPVYIVVRHSFPPANVWSARLMQAFKHATHTTLDSGYLQVWLAAGGTDGLIAIYSTERRK